MAFSSAFKSFPRMFSQHVFRMPKIIQQNRTSFGNWKSIVGDLRATLGRRHILTVTRPQSKTLSIDVHPQVLGKNVLSFKSNERRATTRGLTGGKSNDRNAPAGPDSRSEPITAGAWTRRESQDGGDEGRPAVCPASEPRIVMSGEHYERATRLTDDIMPIAMSMCEQPWTAYGLRLTDSDDPDVYADFAGGAVVVTVGMVRALDDDELRVAIGHGLARFVIRDALRRSALAGPARAGPTRAGPTRAGPARAGRFRRIALGCLAASHLVCVTGMDVACRCVALLDTAVGIAYTGWMTADWAWRAIDGPATRWRDVYAADRLGLQMAVCSGAPQTAGRAMLRKLEQIDREHYGLLTWAPRKTHPDFWNRDREMRRFEATLKK